jgi:hypothetical protein
MYFHPYEFHDGWLIPPSPAWRGGLRAGNLKFAFSRVLLHNFRTKVVGRRLRLLLERFEFMPLGEIYRTRHGGLIKEHGRS